MTQAVQAMGPRSKRGVIIEAAVQTFGEGGYEQTKWASIADEVGIGQTALYHYFESKAHCLLTIMSLELRRSLEKFRAATAGIDSASEALEAAIRAAFEVSSSEILQMRILQNHMDLLARPRPSEREEEERQTARQLVRDIESEWTALLERGMAVGDFPERDAHAEATVVLGMVINVWRWYRPGGPVSMDTVRDLIMAGCLRVVGP